MKEVYFDVTKKEQTLDAFEEIIDEKYRGKIVCIGDRPASVRHKTIFTLTEELLSKNKKVLIVSNDFDFSRFLVELIDIDILKNNKNNLRLVNDFAIFNVEGNLRCHIDDWKECSYVFIETNLRFLAMARASIKDYFDAIRKSAGCKNILLFTYLKRTILKRVNFCPQLKDFPKGIENFVDKVFGYTSKNRYDERVVLLKELY